MWSAIEHFKINLKVIWKKPLTLVGSAKAVFWPNCEKLSNNAQTKFFCANFFSILLVPSHGILINLWFFKSYGQNARKTKQTNLGTTRGTICAFFEFLRHFKGEHGHLCDMDTYGTCPWVWVRVNKLSCGHSDLQSLGMTESVSWFGHNPA